MFQHDIVTFEYVNHKGECETRLVRPIRIWFGSTAYHQQPQWLLEAFDLDRMQTRDFAMSGILGEWQEASDVRYDVVDKNTNGEALEENTTRGSVPIAPARHGTCG